VGKRVSRAARKVERRRNVNFIVKYVIIIILIFILLLDAYQGRLYWCRLLGGKKSCIDHHYQKY